MITNRANSEPFSIDLLERDLEGIQFDREVTLDFLADAHAASVLNSRRLLLSLFSWLRSYHAARGMRDQDLSRLTLAFANEVKRSAPTNLEEISILAVESAGWQPHDVPRPKAGREIFQSYLRMLLNHEGVEARNLILEEVADGKSIRFIYSHVLQPAMIEIGRLWLENKINVADEHYATAVTEVLMNTLHPLLKQRPQRGRVLLVGVQAELHELGLRMVRDFFELDGWDTTYFGPNLPLESICSAIVKERPDLIAMSVTTPSNLLATAETIQRIHAMSTARSTPVLVGGYPFLVDHSLCDAVGANAWAANGSHAVRVARSLLKRDRVYPVALSEASGTSTEISEYRPYGTHKPTQNEELIRFISELSALHTELRKRNAVIEQLNEEKNRFLGMAAHDLRNELATATLASRMLAQTKEGLSGLQRRLVDLLDSTMISMLDLVDGYLDVSRIEAGKLEIHPESIDLISLVEDRLSAARLVGDEAGVRVFRSGIIGPATVNIDPKRIRQALNNLLINAIKFSPHGGEVEVVVGEEGDRYVIDVMDEGPGVPSQQGKNLFSPFTTLEVSGEKRESGTGLGLHIARRVVEAHDGSIEFRPRKPRGSIFSIALPRFLSKKDPAGPR